MTPLPLQVPAGLQQHPNLHKIVSAYNICLRMERSLQEDVDKGDDVGRKQIYIRILGYLIHYVPTDRGLGHVVTEIVSAVRDSDLLEVGKRYFDHYIRAFRSNKGPIPTPSNHASRPSFDTCADMINDTLVEAPQSHTGAKTNALIRDGYRCVVTKKYDETSVSQIQELEERVTSDPSAGTEPTQCAHIFSESTNYKIEPGSDKRDYAASMWAVMEHFGYESLPQELNGPQIHRLENVMTLAPGCHSKFDQLRFWFVATGKMNEYKLEAAHSYTIQDYPKIVTFTTPDQDKLPVPSPNYLAIHAACAKVAHLSGAAGCIDQFYRDMDDSKTLAPDGASASMLEHAIFELQPEARGCETAV